MADYDASKYYQSDRRETILKIGKEKEQIFVRIFIVGPMNESSVDIDQFCIN